MAGMLERTLYVVIGDPIKKLLEFNSLRNWLIKNNVTVFSYLENGRFDISRFDRFPRRPNRSSQQRVLQFPYIARPLMCVQAFPRWRGQDFLLRLGAITGIVIESPQKEVDQHIKVASTLTKWRQPNNAHGKSVKKVFPKTPSGNIGDQITMRCSNNTNINFLGST